MEKPIFNRCLRCNRLLKTELAKERGYGEYCWKKHQSEVKKRQTNLFEKFKSLTEE